MEIKQKLTLRRLLLPALNQSLAILSLSAAELEDMIKTELLNNPCLEEATEKPAKTLKKEKIKASSSLTQEEMDFRMESLSHKITLQDALLRQLGMFTQNDEEFAIGQEIIGNIDEGGYLRVSLEDIALSLKGISFDKLEKVLKIIQRFDPPGVGARNISECLLIQLEYEDNNDPLIQKIVKDHLNAVAKKEYKSIAKSLNKSIEEIQPLIQKIIKLNPKPGSNFSEEEIQQVIPDVTIEPMEDGEIRVSITNEDSSTVSINNDYKELLKNKDLDPETKKYLSENLQNALNLLSAVSKRHTTLRKIAETLAEIQKNAITEGLCCLKPLTFKEVAEKINLHESTVCRAVMAKFVKLPYGVVALKEFFSSQIMNTNGEAISSNFIKKAISELINKESKKKPYSDLEISKILSKEHSLKVSRRTIAKYREELKILNSTFRKEKN
jgi:RNA polymerase sigma-54 factor